MHLQAITHVWQWSGQAGLRESSWVMVLRKQNGKGWPYLLKGPDLFDKEDFHNNKMHLMKTGTSIPNHMCLFNFSNVHILHNYSQFSL